MPALPPVRLRPALAALLLAGCATTGPRPEPAAPTPEVKPQAAAPAAEPEGNGPVIPFKYQPDVQKAWGLRVARHRTLPPPGGDSDSSALHFDTEENSRLWSLRLPNGDWVLNEVLTSHNETKNGDPDDDPILVALTGVTVGMEIGPDGKFKSAVDPGGVLKQLARRWPGGEGGDFEQMEPQKFAKELERDWRFGAQVYFDQPVHVGSPVYSLLSVSLPQLPGQYVIVAEKFEAPVANPDGSHKVSSTQEMFGRNDPRWASAKAKLMPVMMELGVPESEILNDFQGKGGETIGVESLQVYNSSYTGVGIFPLSTPRGTFPLRFEIEEVAGTIPAPALPVDPRQTASPGIPASHLAHR